MTFKYVHSIVLGFSLINFNALALDEIQENQLSRKQLDWQAPQNSSVIEEEFELIKGKNLSLWGVALFQGTDIFSAAIRALTESEWSHVGIVLADQNEVKYCFESTGSFDEIVYQHMLPQVQIHTWDEILDSYSGKIALRQFAFENYDEQKTTKMTKMVNKLLGTPYEQDLSTLVRCLTRDNAAEKPTSLFCSELAAKCLIHLGYLPTSRLPNNYMPRDFSSKEFIPLQGAKLGKEQPIRTHNQKWCVIF